jgi:hypothetical protein
MNRVLTGYAILVKIIFTMSSCNVSLQLNHIPENSVTPAGTTPQAGLPQAFQQTSEEMRAAGSKLCMTEKANATAIPLKAKFFMFELGEKHNYPMMFTQEPKKRALRGELHFRCNDVPVSDSCLESLLRDNPQETERRMQRPTISLINIFNSNPLNLYVGKVHFVQEYLEAYFDPIANSSNEEDINIIEARRRYPSLYKISKYLQEKNVKNLSSGDLPRAFRPKAFHLREINDNR